MSANEKVPLNSRKIAAMPVQKPSFIDIRVHPISNKLVQVGILAQSDHRFWNIPIT